MPYVSNNPRHWEGESVGSGQCVAYAQKAAGMPLTAHWKQGDTVQGNEDLKPGTAIATFDATGRYGNHTDGRSHVAIFLSQDKNGIKVLDQFMKRVKDPATGETKRLPQPVTERTIYFRPAARAENDGRNYHVVE